MSTLSRGNCSVCGHEVALRSADLVREHRVHPYDTKVCPGSGRPTSQVTERAER